MAKVTCSRCHGSGRLECYKHIQRGICYKCEGVGLVDDKATCKAKAEIARIKAQDDAKTQYQKMIKEANETEHAGMKERRVRRAEEFLARYA